MLGKHKLPAAPFVFFPLIASSCVCSGGVLVRIRPATARSDEGRPSDGVALGREAFKCKRASKLWGTREGPQPAYTMLHLSWEIVGAPHGGHVLVPAVDDRREWTRARHGDVRNRHVKQRSAIERSGLEAGRAQAVCGISPHWFVIGTRRRITHCGECPRACSPERGTCVGPKTVMYAFRADRRRHSFPTAGPGCRMDSTPGQPPLLGTPARICSLSPLAPPAKERTELAAKPAAPASGPEALLELKKDQPLPSLPSPARALIL